MKGASSFCKLAIFLAVLLPAFASAIDAKAGPYTLKVTTDPAVVPIGKAALRIEVSDSAGKPISGADVRTLTGMPGMFMGERDQQAVPDTAQPGVYISSGQFPMAGAYSIKVTIAGAQGTATATIPTSTGESTGTDAGGSFPVVAVLIALGVISLAAYTLSRMRRTGQRVSFKPLLSRQVLGSLLVLGVAFAIAVYAVNNFRRKGAMTPIEAQVMDMSMPPPEGTTPVTLVTAERRSLAATVTYTGQAVGYVEQDVYPRVTGVIEWMPLYTGDRVSKGQLLARLDTSQLEPEVAEKGAAVSTAQEGVGVAMMEYQSAVAEISEAQAEASSARGAVEEAKAMLAAVTEGRTATATVIVSTEAEVTIAKEEAAASYIEFVYWRDEMERATKLLGAGAISREEFQRVSADKSKAQANMHHGREMIRKAEAALASARAGVRRADAEITAARRKVQQAEAQVRAQDARIRTARSNADAARRRIAQAQAGVREAQAGLKGASAAKGYALIRSQIDGVVTQRLISPGVLVNPGQAILRVAQIQPIRVQANVAETDLARVRVGASVKLSLRGKDKAPIVARVSSVTPAVDSGARTGVVEAILPNKNSTFLPGHFVSMEITTGEEESMVVVPSAAVQRQVVVGDGVQSTETGAYVWVADPIAGQSGRFTVTRSDVKVGESSGELTAIRSGLKSGQQVVVIGIAGLRSGQVVTAAEAPSTMAGGPTVLITEAGYEPPTVTVRSGKRTKITFLRKTDATCGTEVVFPTLKITRSLPLNKPVEVELPPQAEGVLRFTCGMDMFEGKVVVN